MSPPLMCNFVRGHFLHKAGELCVDVAKKHPSLRGIGVGGNRQINQIGPGLPKRKIGLLGYVDLVIRSLAKVVGAEL